MALGIKYFKINRENDWVDNGLSYGINFKNDCLRIPFNVNQKSFFISNTFDSMTNEVYWNRFKLDLNFSENSLIKICIYTSDELKIGKPNEENHKIKGVNINTYLMSKEILPDKKFEFLCGIGGRVYTNFSDIELFSFKGRYMWFIIEAENYDIKDIEIKELKIEFPKNSFVQYLPEIYQRNVGEDLFLERFIGIFQSIYLDLDDNITNISSLFDPKSVNFNFLECLVEWLSFKNSSLWEEKKLRKALSEVVFLYKKKGTKQAISRIIELYIGETPIIIEKIHISDTDFYTNDKERLDILYGGNGCFFCVIIKDELESKDSNYANLSKIISNFKPIDSMCNLVVLNYEIHLDHHCYIGINSKISGNKNMVVNSEKTSYVQGILI